MNKEKLSLKHDLKQQFRSLTAGLQLQILPFTTFVTCGKSSFCKMGRMFTPTSYSYGNNEMFPYHPTHVHDHILMPYSCLGHGKYSLHFSYM